MRIEPRSGWRAIFRPHFPVGLGAAICPLPSLSASVAVARLGRGPLREAPALSVCPHSAHSPPAPSMLPRERLACSPL